MQRFASLFVVPCALACLFTAPSWAASDGSLGSTSVGSFDLTLDLLDAVRISGMQDVALGNISVGSLTPGGAQTASVSDICVFSNGLSGQYTLAVSTTSGSLALDGGTSTTIPYAFEWDDGTNSESVTATGTMATNFLAARILACLLDRTATLTLTIQNDDLIAADAGSYSQQITLTVSPL